jgi:hypothetical protein
VTVPFVQSLHFIAFFWLVTYAVFLSEDFMSQQPVFNRILAGGVTFVGLGIVWIAIVNNIPSQQDLSAKESPPPSAQGAQAERVPEPVLDLSIPGAPSAPQPSERPPAAAWGQVPTRATASDPRAAQVARLRCEAEVEALCPEASDGLGRRQCLETRAQHLTGACQEQLRERLVKWKEERSQFKVACQTDIKRFCPDLRPGVGQTLQCLQQHAQQVSDGCYEMLPKGTLYFK